MRVIRFPGAAEAELAGREAAEQIDAALNGETAGADSDALRELRADVRALAAPPAADFERELQARVAEWALEGRGPRHAPGLRVAALRAGLRPITGRLLALGAAGAVVATVLAVLLVVGSGEPSRLHSAVKAGPAFPAGATAEHHGSGPAFSAEEAAGAAAPSAAEAVGSGTTTGSARLQQLGASVTLAAHGPEGVQEAADAVARLAASAGGYVESSHVQVRRSGGPSEAELRLSVPSAKLSSSIAALGRIAPVRAVSQESEDITSTYEAARRQLADDEAVRHALLRALAAATTEGRIDSLREQLASNRQALARDRARLHSIAHTAATSQLEVAITGSGAAGPGSGQGTLDRGLHDAAHVLAVAGAVALVALAVIVPLALLALALDALRRSWRRRRREAVLEP